MPCYDQSCTSADLVNIPSLALSDTFNTWFDRTNQIIEVANAINIFDIGVGPTDGGLRLERGCSGSYYSGVAVLYVNPGAGIGVGTESFTNNYNKVIVDVARLQDLGGNTATNPSVNDYFILSEKLDTRQGPDGTPKRVLARRILPNEIEFGEDGNGTLTIAGNLTVLGNVDIQGLESYIDSNDLRIEDKIIELAYGRYAELTVFDDGSGTLTAGSFSAGLTAYYDDTQIPNEDNASTIGTIFSWSIGETGVSGTVRISSFTRGGVNDFESAPEGDPLLGGKLVVTGGGYLGVLDVTGPIGIGDYFLNDNMLQPAGIVIKGAESDKTFLWVCNAPEGGKNWNAFVSNKNLGVSGPANWILSSKFASYGYTDPTVDNTFTYLGEGDSYTKYSVGQQLVMEHSPTGNHEGTTFGIVHMGSTGPHVFPNVPVYDWVKYFNADQLDGAHASTASVPWTIPIMGADGRVGNDLVAADSIRKTFAAGNHPFAVGDVLRVNIDGSLTFASADTIPTAEALGMVASVSGSNVTLVTKGFITGLSGARINSNLPLVTGNVYFLSPTQPGGGLIDDPDSGIGIEPGEVRKAMLLAMGSDSGYVLNYSGIVNGDSSDVVHMTSFTPIGAIQPYAGSVSDVPRNWMLCDGRRLSANEYSQLHGIIGNRYYIEGTKDASSNVIQLAGTTYGIQVNDNVTVRWISGGSTIQASGIVQSVNTGSNTISVSLSSDAAAFDALATGVAIQIYGRSSPFNTSIFFLPDLRRRTAIGSSFGDGIAGSGSVVPPLSLGQAGGSHQITLNREVPTSAPGDEDTAWGNTSNTVNSLSPYVAINWIIRVRKGADATILEGHNHDLFYIRHDIEHSISGGAANNLSFNSRERFRNNARVLGDGRDGPATFHNNLSITGGASIRTLEGQYALFAGPSFIESLRVNKSADIGYQNVGGGNLRVYGTGHFDQSLSAGGDLTVRGNITVGNVLNNGTGVSGNARFYGSLTADTLFATRGGVLFDWNVTDDLWVGDDMYVTGDAVIRGKTVVGNGPPGLFSAPYKMYVNGGPVYNQINRSDIISDKHLTTKEYVDTKFSVSLSSIKTAARGHPNFSGAPYGGNYNETVPNGESWLMLWFLDGGWSTSDSDNESFRIGAKLSGTEIITGNGVTKFGDFLWNVVSTNGGVSIGGSHAIYFKVS